VFNFVNNLRLEILKPYLLTGKLLVINKVEKVSQLSRPVVKDVSINLNKVSPLIVFTTAASAVKLVQLAVCT
jgi:hypothetical protein